MRDLIVSLLLMVAAMSAPVQAQKPVAAPSVESFSEQLAAMGYPSELSFSDNGIPMLNATVGGHPTVFALGGCKDRKNCGYLVLSSSFSDVVHPPLAWLEQINSDYDLAKVSISENGLLTIQSGIVLGGEGLPVSTFRMVLDQWQAALSEIAAEAIKAQLNTK